MLIILEGPDCAGKSTLAQSILTQLAVRYPSDIATLIHRGPPTTHPLHEYVKPLLDYVPNLHEHIVCDRWHLGEVVYPTVMGRRTDMSSGTWKWIELFLQSRGALTVVINPPFETLKARLRERGDNHVNLAQLERVSRGFELHAQREHRNFDHSPTVDDVLAMADGVELHAPRQFVTYIGPREPSVLLVGDVRANEALTSKGPAFAPFPATSGRYLMDALTTGRAARWMMPFGLVNACDVDNIEHVWMYHARPAVIALGQKASAKLDEFKIPHAAIAHPQYVRRFHHHAQPAYGELIATIAGTEKRETDWRP